jgi:hypothetical protein
VTAESVVLETSPDGRSWSEAGTAVTDLSGGFIIPVDTLSGDLTVRARFGGTPEYPAAVSAVITVKHAHVVVGLSRPQP